MDTTTGVEGATTGAEQPRTAEPPRTAAQRKADVLAKLRAVGDDVWVATSAPGVDGSTRAHLVPLSLAWLDERIVLATPGDSLTVRNLRATRTARLGLGPTRDVVMIDAVLDGVTTVDGVPAGTIDRYAVQAGWDVRTAGPGYVLIRLRPQRIQAWREENELPGRTLMRDGVWLI